jgi:biopolymer transport protein TolR
MNAKKHEWFLTTLRRKNDLYCRIDVWGFVGVMVALLFILIVAKTSYVDLPKNSVDLTESYHAISVPGALREDAMRINIKPDGQLYFGYLSISPKDLPDLIRQGLRNGAENKVYILADARAKYGSVIEVLNEIRLAKVEKVSFITWQR